MHEFDDAVLQCFLDNQSQLFPEEDVVSNLEEAENFLEECFAVVVNSVDEVWEYFEEEGIDMDGASGEEILEADEVFDIGDGRYLIKEQRRCVHLEGDSIRNTALYYMGSFPQIGLGGARRLPLQFVN